MLTFISAACSSGCVEDPGGVFMYARPDLLPSLHPKVTGWFAHRSPFLI